MFYDLVKKKNYSGGLLFFVFLRYYLHFICLFIFLFLFSLQNIMGVSDGLFF